MSSNQIEIKALVFDLGRVLLDFDWNQALGVLEKRCVLDRQQIYDRIATHESHRAFEMGAIGSPEFFDLWQRELNFQGTAQELQAIWNGIFTAIEPNIRLLHACRANYKLAILSNTNPAHIESQSSLYDFFDVVDHGIFSYDVGLRKPDPAIYEYLIDRLALPAHQILFIDDLSENIAGARLLGLQALQFQGQDLVKEFKRFGIQPE